MSQAKLNTLKNSTENVDHMMIMQVEMLNSHMDHFMDVNLGELVDYLDAITYDDVKTLLYHNMLLMYHDGQMYHMFIG